MRHVSTVDRCQTMVASRLHLFGGMLLGLTVSLAIVSGQNIVRIAESREPETVNYTGQIHQFSEIGPSGDGTTPRPWVCYPDFNPVDDPIAVVQWQTPDGSVVPTRPLGSPQATGSELFQVTTEGGPALVRGPDYNSPDGEYCCEIPAVPGQRKCVTLTTYPMLAFPVNGRITYNPVTNVVTHSCDPGYAPSNTGQRTCQNNDQWSGTTVTCELIMCPTLSNPENGQVTVNAHTVGGVATYTCNNGYTRNGTGMRMCEEDSGVLGQWTPEEPTCPPVDCGPLNNPTNGQVMVPATTFNNMATYSCNSGYTLNGAQTRTCQASGVWSNAEPTCQVLCPLLTLSNGMVTYSLSEDPPPVGTVATYSCDTGYDLTGNRMRICEEGAGWTGSLPVCNIVDCGAVAPPSNGQVDTSSGTAYNEVATYSCDTGYNLVGPPTRTCQADAMWSSITPVCEFNPLSLTVQTVYNFNNSVVSISHIGEGASALTCHTELTTCCREQDNPSGGALGEWIGPDSNQIPESSTTLGFYVTRQRSSISLNRGGDNTVGGQYCCVIPRTGGNMTFCVNVQMGGSGAPASSGTTVGLSVAIAVILVVSITTIITLVIILIISRLGTRTQQPHHSKQHAYETPDQPVYEDMDMGGAGDHTHLRQCQAYVSKEVLTEREGRGDVGKEDGN